MNALTFFPRLAPNALLRLRALAILALLTPLLSCAAKPDPHTLVMAIESSPTNLDPRIGLDAQSERIGNLIFDDLLSRGEDLNVAPGLAERWEIPDPLTYIFHLHQGVKFHDGRALTSRDVKWTFDSLLQGKVRSTKAAVYRFVGHIDAPDDSTVVFHMKEPSATLLWNVSDGAIGIVPYGSGDEMTRHPVGSGPFKFVNAETDKEVVLERNSEYWGEKPKLERVRFAVVPDETTRALELRKGSADIAVNLTPDTVLTLRRDPQLAVEQAPGTVLAYLGFNLRDPILKDVRVRQAIAYALDRQPMIEYLWRGEAQSARSILPPQSWAYNPDVASYPHDPEKSRQILDAAGYPEVNGVRFHLTMKSGTDANGRLTIAVMQQQLRSVGIILDIRSAEFATFFSDVTHGSFQLYCCLRWIGGNEDPDIFEYVFHSAKFPPNGANRGFYLNPRVDALIDQARREVDQNKRKTLYAEVQSILAEQLPSINLWYLDNVLVHNRRVLNLQLNPAGNYDFLKTVQLAP
jgi:peptide/nickel transport system substrate-binding protein